MKDPDKWYPLRVTYSRELKAREILENAGCICFVPMCVKIVERNGQKAKKTVPAVNNLCFVKAARTFLDRVLAENGMKEYVHYMWSRASREPLVVPDKAMEDFIKVSDLMCEDIVYIREVSPKLREGSRVRVLEGPFAGVEGTVVRVKRSQRVMVELPGMMAVATAYIPKVLLEEVPAAGRGI